MRICIFLVVEPSSHKQSLSGVWGLSCTILRLHSISKLVSSAHQRALRTPLEDAIRTDDDCGFMAGEGVGNAQAGGHLCRYRQLTTQNATSLARRFQNLPGLQLVVQQELEALDTARTAALADLDRLAVASTEPSPEMVEQVSLEPCFSACHCPCHCTTNAEANLVHLVD